MGLAIQVGMLVDLAEHDPEAVEDYRESFASINDVLKQHKLPAHHEPETLPAFKSRADLQSFPYSFLHYLRRVAAHAASNKSGWLAKPFPKSSDPAADPLIDEASAGFDNHLLCHSDCEGYYLPIPFRDVVFDDGTDRIPGGMLGSSITLQKELIAVAPALGIRLEGGELSDEEAARINRESDGEGPLWIEKAVWLTMFEAARLSIQHKTAICFT